MRYLLSMSLASAMLIGGTAAHAQPRCSPDNTTCQMLLRQMQENQKEAAQAEARQEVRDQAEIAKARRNEAEYWKAARWRKISALNGEDFLVDMAPGHIRHVNGSAEAVICAPVERDGRCMSYNTSALIFDCQGHYMYGDSLGVQMYAAPRSVAGRIEALVCRH